MTIESYESQEELQVINRMLDEEKTIRDVPPLFSAHTARWRAWHLLSHNYLFVEFIGVDKNDDIK